ncbi:armadillo-type protein [Helicostylum pulchrum]|nr:armadillo-type protein [Helicostylum pulchrum]
MGKLRQKKKAPKRRTNPIQRTLEQRAKEGAASLPAPTPEQVTPVVEKLSSEDPTERAWAASCVSTFILSDAPTRKLLLSKGVVPILIQRLNDPQQEVRDESLGALRNIASVDNGAAKEYFTRNIMEPLSKLLPQITQTIDLVIKKAPIQDEADADRRKSIWDVTENFIYIIWCICEASDKYVKAINRMNIVTFLTSFLMSGEQCPTRVIVAAGQCLNTLTDDNKDLLIEFKNNPHYIENLLNIVKNNSQNILVQVLSCAILINVRDVVRLTTSWDEDTDAVAELNELLVPVLIKALDYDIQDAAKNTVSAVQSGNVNLHQEESGNITPKPKQPLTNEERYIQSVEDRLSITQLALELLADICVHDEDSEEDGIQDVDEAMLDENEELPPKEDEEEDDDDDGIDQEIFGQTSSAMDDALIRSNPVLHAYIHQIFPQLIRLSTATPISFHQMNLSPLVTHGLVITHQRSLECLNNFLLAMNEVPKKYWFKEYKSDATQLWIWLFNLANEVASSKPEEWARDGILEIVVSCIWALGRGLGQDIPLDHTDVGALCGTYEMIPLESMRIKIVGCLGPIAMRLGDVNTNKVIGIFIMNLLNDKATKPAVAIEALNLLFDVYNDAAFDYDLPVFVQGAFLNNLKQVLPSIRSTVKSIDRRKNFDLRMRGDEALDNLNAFIKYKKNERK